MVSSGRITMHHSSSENVKGAYGRVAYCCPIERPSQWFTHIRMICSCRSQRKPGRTGEQIRRYARIEANRLRMSVTFCYRHCCPSVAAYRRGHWKSAPVSNGSAARWCCRRCENLSCSGSPAWRDFSVPYPPQACQSVDWLPVWLPNDRKGAGIRTLSRAPSRTRTYGLLLRRHFRNVPW